MENFNSASLHTIDYDRLNELYDGDNEQIASLFELFLDEVFPDFQEIEREIDQQNWADVAKTAHKMLPWVGMVGLTALEGKLRSIEAQAKTDRNPEEIKLAWSQFKLGLDKATPLIREELARLTS
ncbi:MULTISPECIES: Hpt domain-containing protein [unclassified Spirosoma]|uniref:Hpt domain-containing protein n=1 Tax=unclassified Spirosoma TaxID=2621999 RepID=UPI000964DD61|nr:MULTISPECIES: Hpt domain-containing protein [unclassified Spirosoma]MBN8821459.1 Hpt domain-containing protein [Spirosoma sp.]OJW78239.1 MAG: phosphorelay protein [Spirosoma sp. 48-14]